MKPAWHPTATEPRDEPPRDWYDDEPDERRDAEAREEARKEDILFPEE